MSVLRLASPGLPPPRHAADLLSAARERDRAGSFTEAMECYAAAIAAAEANGEPEILAEALRRLAVVRQRRGDRDAARQLCERSYAVARRIADGLLAAEALNSLGCVDLLSGFRDSARRRFLQALALGGASRELRARVEQNLSILASSA